MHLQVGQNGGYDTKNATKPTEEEIHSSQLIEKNGGDDETRTRDLCRDSPPLGRWRTQNQEVAHAVVGTHWACWAA